MEGALSRFLCPSAFWGGHQQLGAKGSTPSRGPRSRAGEGDTGRGSLSDLSSKGSTQGTRAQPGDPKVTVTKASTGGPGLVQEADVVPVYTWGPIALSLLPLLLVYPTTI